MPPLNAAFTIAMMTSISEQRPLSLHLQVGLKAGRVFSPVLCYRKSKCTPQGSIVSAIVEHASNFAHAPVIHLGCSVDTAPQYGVSGTATSTARTGHVLAEHVPLAVRSNSLRLKNRPSATSPAE